MPYPSRREKRIQKKSNYQGWLVVLLLLTINLPLILTQNFYLLGFVLPLSLLLLIYTRKKLVTVFTLIIFLSFLSYMEISYRLWAQN